MARHVKALTYTDKVEAVRSGTCRQTIRAVGKRSVCVGDTITFHGWTDRPYRSPWSWRLEVVVKRVYPILINGVGISGIVSGPVINGFVHPWKSMYCDEIARLDFINPPIGEALRDVLFALNGVPEQPEQFQIIRW